MQSCLLQEAWEHFRTNREWPILRSLYSRHGTEDVKKALLGLGGSIGIEQPSNRRWSRYELSLLGVLLTKDGPHLQGLLTVFFNFQRELFLNQPANELATSVEIAERLELDNQERSLLGDLLRLGGIGAGHNPEDDTWSVNAMEGAANFPKVGDLCATVEEWLLRHYEPNAPVFQDQRRLQYVSLPLSITGTTPLSAQPHPPEITTSLERLRERHPDPNKLGFLMMRFNASKPYAKIVETIKATANESGLAIIRADENQFHADLWGNVRTLLHGCGFGIAIYDRIETDEPNANVGLEVGYLMAMNKPVLLLKDQSLGPMPSDLTGKLYKTFDSHDPRKTIPSQLGAWLRDNGIVLER